MVNLTIYMYNEIGHLQILVGNGRQSVSGRLPRLFLTSTELRNMRIVHMANDLALADRTVPLGVYRDPYIH